MHSNKTWRLSVKDSYRGDGSEQYRPDNTGAYVHSDKPYVHSDKPYLHQGNVQSSFGGNAGIIYFFLVFI